MTAASVPAPVGEPASPAAVWALIDGLVGWSAAATAVELGLFGQLADRPEGRTVEDLAGACGAPPDRLAVLVHALVALGLLEHDGARCRLSAVSDQHLVPGRPGQLGDLLVHSPGVAANWPGLAAVVRGAAPAHPVDHDDGFATALAAATFGLQRATASALADALDLPADRPVHVLDVGSGGGAWSRALLDARPGARATLVDRAPLHELARHHLAEPPAADGGEAPLDRTRFVELDLASAPAGLVAAVEGPVDVVVLAHVLRHLPDAVAEAVVAASASLLAPGGTIVVADYLLDAPSPARERAAVLGLTTLANTERGRLVTRDRLDRWLVGVGLDPSRPLDLSPVFSVLAAERSAPT